MLKYIKNYFNAQINEIGRDQALIYYGACLAFGQFLTVIYWYTENAALHISRDVSYPVCWPFWQNCFQLRVLSYQQAIMVISVFGLMAVYTVALFFNKRCVKAGFWFLLLLNIIKMAIYFQDFRLRLNQHYMLFFISFVFLFLPGKRALLRYLLVMFYLWAGTLKLNMEWISGRDLYRDLWLIKGAWVSLACIYVIFLELFIVFGLLVRRKLLFWATFFQLLLFHIWSYSVVGFFYPFLMIVLLMIFPLAYIIKVDGKADSLLTAFVTFKAQRSAYVFIGIFSFLQIFQYIIPGDGKITGEGRLFGLHMFDSQVECKGSFIYKFKDGTERKQAIPVVYQPRIRCDPAVYFCLAKYYCYTQNNNAGFDDLDIYYEVRSPIENRMRPLVDIKDFCSQDIDYSMFKRNPWIRI